MLGTSKFRPNHGHVFGLFHDAECGQCIAEHYTSGVVRCWVWESWLLDGRHCILYDGYLLVYHGTAAKILRLQVHNDNRYLYVYSVYGVLTDGAAVLCAPG